jgi:hypothetical protein
MILQAVGVPRVVNRNDTNRKIIRSTNEVMIENEKKSHLAHCICNAATMSTYVEFYPVSSTGPGRYKSRTIREVSA